MKGPVAVATAAAAAAAIKTEPANGKSGAENVPTVDLLANPIANVQSALEKKLRNLGKRTQKLQQIKLDLANGTKLTEEQMDAISKASEVELQVEFIKDLQKLATQQLRQYQRAARQKEDAVFKKTQENNLNLVKAVLKYQDVLKMASASEFLENAADSQSLTADETAVFKSLHAELTATPADFDAFADYENQMNNLAKKLKDIFSGSTKEVETNVTGLRLQTLLNQMFESPAFQTVKTKTEAVVVVPESNTNEEGAESDDSSLNDFRQESVDSSNDCSGNVKVESRPVDVTGKPILETTVIPETDTKPSEPDAQVGQQVPAPSVTPPTDATVLEVSAPAEESSQVPDANTPPAVTAQPDTNLAIAKDQPEANSKTAASGEHRQPRRGYNNHQRYRRDNMQKGGYQQKQVEASNGFNTQISNNNNGTGRPQHNRPGPRPNFKSRRNSVPIKSNNNEQEEVSKSQAEPTGNKPAEMVVSNQPARRSEPQRPRFFRNDNNYNGETNGNGFQNRRPYVPRNQQGGSGEQQQYRSGGNFNGAGYSGAPRNYERVPRVHQPYECGLRFARD